MPRTSTGSTTLPRSETERSTMGVERGGLEAQLYFQLLDIVGKSMEPGTASADGLTVRFFTSEQFWLPRFRGPPCRSARSPVRKSGYAKLKQGRAQQTSKGPELPPGLEACRTGDVVKLKQMLADSSFDVASVDRFGGSGLHWAASAGHLETCRLLVEHQVQHQFLRRVWVKIW
eukprot:Skav225438  [mRNA]  locus=scaffold1668:40167:44469:- [translate_table: standard]